MSHAPVADERPGRMDAESRIETFFSTVASDVRRPLKRPRPIRWPHLLRASRKNGLGRANGLVPGVCRTFVGREDDLKSDVSFYDYAEFGVLPIAPWTGATRKGQHGYAVSPIITTGLLRIRVFFFYFKREYAAPWEQNMWTIRSAGIARKKVFATHIPHVLRTIAHFNVQCRKLRNSDIFRFLFILFWK